MTQEAYEVMINGIKYVPAKTVVINRELLIRKLLEEFHGPIEDKNQEWIENEAKESWLYVIDTIIANSVDMTKYAKTISDFVDDLAI